MYIHLYANVYARISMSTSMHTLYTAYTSFRRVACVGREVLCFVQRPRRFPLRNIYIHLYRDIQRSLLSINLYTDGQYTQSKQGLGIHIYTHTHRYTDIHTSLLNINLFTVDYYTQSTNAHTQRDIRTVYKNTNLL